MNSLVDALIDYCNNAREKNVNFLIAQYLLNNLSNVENITAKDIIDHCYTSKTSLKKFCQLFGYKNFYLFKLELIALYNFKKVQILNRISNTNYPSLINTFYNLLQIGNKKAEKEALHKQFEEFVEKIHSSRRILLYGGIYPLAIMLNFQIDFYTFGKPVIHYSNIKELEEDIQEDDLLIIVSFTGSFLVFNKNENYNLRNSKATKVLISQNSTMVQTYISDFSYYFRMPFEKDCYESNYYILLLTDIWHYLYFKKYVLEEDL